MKWLWRLLGLALLVVIVLDAIRYLKPEPAQQTALQPEGRPADIRGLTFVYNAYGGLLPGLADLLHKELFPDSYACNLCYQTYGTFTMKEDWRQYLDSLPLKQTFLHKDSYQREYREDELPLPVVLASDGSRTWVLISAEEMNRVKSLQGLKDLVDQRIGR